MANISNINDFFIVDSVGLKAAVGADLANGNGSPYVGTDFTVVGRDASSPVANLWLSNFTHKSYILISDNSSNFIIRDSGAGNRLTIDSSGNSTFSGNVGIGIAPVTDARLTLGLGSESNVILSFAPASGGNGEIRSTTSTGTFTFTNSNGATELMRIDSSGNVLIGTTSDLGKVTIQNDAASQYALRIIRSTSASQGLGGFYEGASNEGILYLIDGSNNAGVLLSSAGDSYFNSGNVGIGTNSPDKKLEILSTASNHLRLAYSETAFWDLFQNAADGSFRILKDNGSLFTFAQSGNLGIGTDSPSRKLDVRDTSNTQATILAYNKGASFTGTVYEAITDRTASSAFNLMNLKSSTVSKFLVRGDGNVGIGTTSPGAKLDVRGSAGGYLKFDTNGSNSTIKSDYNLQLYADDTGDNSSPFANMQFFTAGANERMRIKSNGNVGINYTDPQAKLHVSDSIGTTIRIDANYNYSGNRNWTLGLNDFGGGNWGSFCIKQSAGQDLAPSIRRFGIQLNGHVGIGYVNNNTTIPRELSVRSISGNCELHLQREDFDGFFFSAGNGYLATYWAGTGTPELMRITSGGDVLIGTQGIPNGTSIYGSAFTAESSSRMLLRMASSTTGAVNLVQFYNGNGLVGKIQTSGSATSFITSSDYRLKEDLQDFNGLDKVSKIKIYDFKWKTDESRSYGVMAHELQEVLPDAVSGEKDAEEMQGVDYSKIVPLLVKSIQELKAEIEILKNK